MASKFIWRDKNIFKVGNLVKNTAAIDNLMFLLWYLDILLSLKIQKSRFKDINEEADPKNLVKFARKHLCRGLFSNKVADWKSLISLNGEDFSCEF